MKTENKPLVTMISKDITTISQWLQHTMLYIHQYNMCIVYKPGPDLYTADWLSHHNHNEKKDQEISTYIYIQTLSTAIGIPVCISVESKRKAISIDAELKMLQTYMIRSWAQTKDDLEPTVQRYWPIRLDLGIIDGVAMKDK